MSRADKRFHREHVLGSENDTTRVKLYAFANTRPSYNVCFAPERPLMVLKTQKSINVTDSNRSNSISNTNNNNSDNNKNIELANNCNALVEEALSACSQWEPLSHLLFTRQPNTTHAMYVVDASSFCSTSEEKEEQINGASMGEYLKSIRNVVSRLNTHNGALIAAGVSCFIAFKYMLVGEKRMGHSDRLLQQLILVRPPRVEFFTSLVAAVRRQLSYHNSSKSESTTHKSSDINDYSNKSKNKNISSKGNNNDLTHHNVCEQMEYPLFDVCVLVSGIDGKRQCNEWETFLHNLQSSKQESSYESTNLFPLISSYKVHCVTTPSIFEAIVSEADVIDEGVSVDLTRHFAEPRLYRIDFALSRYTKAIEQHVHLCSHEECCHNVCEQHHCASEEKDDHNVSDQDEETKQQETSTVRTAVMREPRQQEESDQCNVKNKEKMSQSTLVLQTKEENKWSSKPNDHNDTMKDNNSNNNGGDDGDDDDDDYDTCSECERCALVKSIKTNFIGLENCTSADEFQVEGRVINVNDNLFGTTDGVIYVNNLQDLINLDHSLRTYVNNSSRKGAAISLNGKLVRHGNGCVSLSAEAICKLPHAAEEASLTAALHKEELPLHYNVSTIAVACGGLIIRGRKCALVRTGTHFSAHSHFTTHVSSNKEEEEEEEEEQEHHSHHYSDGNDKGNTLAVQHNTELYTHQYSKLHIPYDTHNSLTEDAMTCAVRAICDQCDISSDNFYIPSYLPPVMMYYKENNCHECESDNHDSQFTDLQPTVKCVMLYTALAINPPPNGPESDLIEDAPEPDEPYDWVSYEKALQILSPHDAEHEAVVEMQRHLHHAYVMGLYRPVEKCGMFGDKVKSSHDEQQQL